MKKSNSGDNKKGRRMRKWFWFIVILYAVTWDSLGSFLASNANGWVFYGHEFLPFWLFIIYLGYLFIKELRKED